MSNGFSLGATGSSEWVVNREWRKLRPSLSFVIENGMCFWGNQLKHILFVLVDKWVIDLRWRWLDWGKTSSSWWE
jgi:hypothetical protein